MKFIALFLLFAPSVFAAGNPIQVFTEVSVDGKVIPRARTMTFPLRGSGSSSDELPGGGYLKVKMTTAPAKGDAVEISYDVSYSSGRKTINAKPTLVVKLGQEASISVGPSGKEELTLRVKASEVKNPAQVVDTFQNDELENYAKMPMSDEAYLETLEMTDPPPAESQKN